TAPTYSAVPERVESIRGRISRIEGCLLLTYDHSPRECAMINLHTPQEDTIMPLDIVDRRMLEILQREGRISNAALADRLHLSPSPCLRRMRALEREGVITGYRAVVDRARLGLGLTVFVEIKVEDHSDRTATHR